MHLHRVHRFTTALVPLALFLGLVTAGGGCAHAFGLEHLPEPGAGPSFGSYPAASSSPNADILPTPSERILPDTGSWAVEGECGDPNHPSAGLPWCWQWLPDGLVWRSYLAGVKESRFAWVMSDSSFQDTIWDATLGGRVALLRYGTPNAYRPNGWELQLEGAAQPRIWPTKDSWPLISTDYVIGVPIVYASGPWQFKTGYRHLSSHLGDEFMILNPTFPRINYMRDEWMFGVGYYWTENLRLYAEADYAFSYDGGAKPWQLQFGTDWSPAVRGGAPFAAFYGNMRQELDYGGYFVVQGGWQVRGGASMHTFRIGLEYVNGGSTQYEFFDQFEQRLGFGLWYDY